MSEPDLSHHYKVLKQFLDISDDSGSRTKSNSSRAMRAREKLLKLSGAQFRELSTDVYDELKRRIDESQAEPDFLLPKSTFHPKRNQARQKLSSLPQTRFKDLVSDISYEISRRNLHIPPEKSAPPSETASDRDIRRSNDTEPSVPSAPSVRSDRDQSHHIDGPQDVSHSTMDEPAANSTTQDPDISQLSHEESKQTIAVQPTTVIPTKANLTWSSDEEEEEDHRAIKGAAAGAGVGAAAGIAAKSLMPNGDSKELEDLKSALQKAEERASELERANEELKSNLATTLSQKDTLEAENKQHLARGTDTKELNALRDEIEGLKSSAAALRLENQALKNKNWKNSRHQSRDLAALSRENSSSGQLASSPGQSGSRPHSGSLNHAVDLAARGSPTHSPSRSIASNRSGPDVNSELKKLHEKMAALDAPQNLPSTSRRESSLKAEALKWQERYQDVQAGIIKNNLLSSSPQLQKHVSPSGLIPSQNASDFFASIEAFLISLYDDEADSELLFERISNVALLANKLASVGNKSALYENDHLAVNVREAAGHSLTATRYYGSNKKILPRVVVERSVDELAFTVCDLVSTCKLSDGTVPQEQPIPVPDQSKDSNDAIRPLKIGRSTNLSPPEDNHSYNDQSRGLSPMEDFSTPRSRGLSADNLQRQDDEPIDSPSPSKILPGSLPVNEAVDQENTKKEEPVKKLTMFERLSGTRKKETNLSEPAPPQESVKPSESTSSPANSSSVGATGAVAAGALGAAAIGASAVGATTTGATANGTDDSAIAGDAKDLESKDRSLTESNTSSKAEGLINKKVPESSEGGRSPSQNKENLAPSTPHSASKTNILDKVRQFESPEESPSNRLISKTKSPSSMSVKNAKELFTEKAAESASPSQSSPNASKSNDNTPTRSRSLFQTLRNKFAGEAKTEEAKAEEAKAEEAKAEEAKAEEAKAEEAKAEEAKAEEAKAEEGKAEEGKANEDDEPKETERQTVQPDVLPESNGKHVDVKDSVTKAAVGAAAGAAAYVGADKVADSIKKSDEKPTDDGDLNKEPVDKFSDAQNHEVTQNEEPIVTKSEARSIEADEEQGLKPKPSLKSLSGKSPSFKVKKVNYAEKQEESEEESEEEEDSDYDDQEEEARQRQEYRKSMAAATFNFDLFDIDDPDNTLTQVLLYLEHQTVQVISTIQDLLTAIKKPDATRGELRENSKAISEVIKQMADATKTSMNQTRNHQLKEHGSWVVTSLEDCNHRMNNLCRPNADKSDEEFADKNFKQRLAGISFDIAKCTKELVKTVEEASLKEDIAQLDARLNQPDDDLT
ncbi:hypothetical protein CA3LBN_002504 [Candidozyma haemuli]|uniref:GIT Spa2 homology (SHD) domain-containing protein n=1 Tax=Candidozyma haemuli TaxID=45357 RepID=A0ABX8I6Z2_9ASCO|nr:hypothetical protein CA3LBN_002504 [[Candida] haemuloni]